MKVVDLLKGVKYSTNVQDLNVDVEKLAIHTDDVEAGTTYFCLKGETFDGHDFAKVAIKKGACCLVVDHFLQEDIPQIKVDDCRKCLALAS